MGALKANLPDSDLRKLGGMGLRVGHMVGEFYWQNGLTTGGPESLVLKEEDLSPLSLKNVESRPGMPVISQLSDRSCCLF